MYRDCCAWFQGLLQLNSQSLIFIIELESLAVSVHSLNINTSEKIIRLLLRMILAISSFDRLNIDVCVDFERLASA